MSGSELRVLQLTNPLFLLHYLEAETILGPRARNKADKEAEQTGADICWECMGRQGVADRDLG